MPARWRQPFTHAVRTAVAASASLALARLVRVPEPYWAPMITLIVMQSTLGASWGVSKSRLIGTAIGAAAGVGLSFHFPVNAILFGLTILALGIIFALARLDQSAYRFAGVTVAMVALVEHGSTSPTLIALHRCAQVCIGIVVALALAWFWPENPKMDK